MHTEICNFHYDHHICMKQFTTYLFSFYYINPTRDTAFDENIFLFYIPK